jgi:glutamine amidotransferase
MTDNANKLAIAVVDYGMGNLQSVLNAFEVLGHDAVLVEEASELVQASAIVVPGVGAFRDGMANIQERGFVEVLERKVLEEGTPFLGVCLGLQILAGESEEHGTHRGLGWLQGSVRRVDPADPEYSVPHMGWNEVSTANADEVLFADIEDGVSFYFVHSYHLKPTPGSEELVTTTAWHGESITASVRKNHIFGVQFHPEKSQAAGLKLYENFVDFVGRRD